ncbi:MAG: SPFH domain-containing protein [Gammaproteobacteria bacterium]|nr:SPFH domain-containing protein [Gammaproteobacteria bacterium]
MNGWLSLTINIAIIPVAVVLLAQAQRSPVLGLLAVLTGLLGVLMLFGYFTLQPNEARVLILFGRYKGTVRRSGFFWANPFYARVRGKVAIGTGKVPAGRNGSTVTGILYDSLKTKLSLRIHNFNSDKLKVNDKRGNPIEIAAVVVWRVADTAQAAFDVENYDEYVQVQSESAIRGIASLYAYDQGENDEITLRGGGDEVAAALKHELEARLARAGVVVEEARLTHLAYAPEIASAMLRRQQADAVIAARRVIVDGAVSMVDMALRQLGERDIVTLDEERKAAMVSNLMVVLCGTSEASPVINTGTLYN